MAWLALLAMALIVAMPAISRVMPVADALPHSAHHHAHHGMAEGHAPALPDHSGHGIDHCGYCVLFELQSVLASGHVLFLVPAAPVGSPEPWIPTVEHDVPSLLGAQPRGPPLIG
ncbi:DUF2946 domain-containing protein [Dyella solisilvae]|uniref:DUF2946 domain-containing protein n=1 Tax=Dyella solisilvae TaxID=1920168 RepID=A0A370K3Z0_9GAMM|nr:DUF2946 domain-containing protein [Dyella solisilvae]